MMDKTREAFLAFREAWIDLDLCFMDELHVTRAKEMYAVMADHAPNRRSEHLIAIPQEAVNYDIIYN